MMGAKQDRQTGIDEWRTTGWQRYSPNTTNANDNFAPLALAA